MQNYRYYKINNKEMKQKDLTETAFIVQRKKGQIYTKEILKGIRDLRVKLLNWKFHSLGRDWLAV